LKSIYGSIQDLKVTKEGKLFVKVLHNGDVIGTQTVEDVKEDMIDPDKLRYKVIKSSQLAPSSLKATDNYSAIIGSAKNRMVSSERYGNIIVGSTAFTAHPENIRIGGAFRFNGQITSTMPSTIVTPVPTLKFDYPMADMLKGMGELLGEYQNFLAGVL